MHARELVFLHYVGYAAVTNLECPDFLESLIPKIPPGDSEHPVHTKTTVTKSCDHDRTHMVTHTCKQNQAAQMT